MSFDFQPTLEGPALVLRPMAADDLEALYVVSSDPLLWAGHPVPDRHERPIFEEMFAEGLASGCALVVIDKALGEVIGSSRYSLDHAVDGELEIGRSYLARKYWGGSTNAEMKHLMLVHLFANFDTAIFRVGQDNARSRRAMEKIGGQLTDRTQIMHTHHGDVLNLIYAIKRDDFKGLI